MTTLNKEARQAAHDAMMKAFEDGGEEDEQMDAAIKAYLDALPRTEAMRLMKVYKNHWPSVIDYYTVLEALSGPNPTVVEQALRNIAEGNLGDQPWQANYERIRQVAADALASLPDRTGEPVAGEWAIDQSTGTDILTYKQCSVIEDEQAHFVLGLVEAAEARLAQQAERATAVTDIDWEKMARAQDRKLHAVLHVPGVKEVLRELKWPDQDDPEADGTDFAHPAWWRGNDAGVESVCRTINEILDGKERLTGTAREPWESTRRRLFALVGNTRDTERLDALRKLCGYVEDGSCDYVTIGQDDATKTWSVRVGKRHGNYGESLREAIDKAAEKENGEG